LHAEGELIFASTANNRHQKQQQQQQLCCRISSISGGGGSSSSIMAITCHADCNVSVSVLVHKDVTYAFAAADQSVTHLKHDTDELNAVSSLLHACSWFIRLHKQHGESRV
jgi:hypothetical protein